jgi:hypothetical protein
MIHSETLLAFWITMLYCVYISICTGSLRFSHLRPDPGHIRPGSRSHLPSCCFWEEAGWCCQELIPQEVRSWRHCQVWSRQQGEEAGWCGQERFWEEVREGCCGIKLTKGLPFPPLVVDKPNWNLNNSFGEIFLVTHRRFIWKKQLRLPFFVWQQFLQPLLLVPLELVMTARQLSVESNHVAADNWAQLVELRAVYSGSFSFCC